MQTSYVSIVLLGLPYFATLWYYIPVTYDNPVVGGFFMKELQTVVFSLNGQMFGADAAQIYHIVNYRDARDVQDMPDYVEGTIEAQGITIPVVNLGKRLGLSGSEAASNAKVLIVKDDDRQTGFLVDEVKEILHLTEDNLVPLPTMLQNMADDCLANVIMKDDLLFSMVNLKKVYCDL